MGNVGVPELIFIFVLALLIFGPRKLPELGRTLGKALAEFRRASAEMRGAVEEEMRGLERHAQELESKTQDALLSVPAPPEGSAGSGSIDPQPGAPPGSAAAPLAAEEPAQEKPANGDPKPA